MEGHGVASNIWKKTADGLPPPDENKRVIGIWMASDGLPVVSIYYVRCGVWTEFDERWQTLKEAVYWAYEDELALSVLGEY